MKENPAERRLRERMGPGALSLGGFLGSDDRDVAQIVAADLGELAEAGVTQDQVADVLDELHAAADDALESPRNLFDDRVTVRMTEVRGRIPCPFGCGDSEHKGVVEVRLQDRVFSFTPLHSHLIRDHGFFQGRGAPFRLAPADVIAVVRIARGG